MPFNEDWVQNVFTYHAPDDGQKKNYQEIREAAKALARVIVANTPNCADQTAALRKLRESVMTANAAVALKGAV